MTAWRQRSFWSKIGAWAWLMLMAVADVFTGGGGLGWTVDRRRVFSPGFIALCVFVAVVELIALNHFYSGG